MLDMRFNIKLFFISKKIIFDLFFTIYRYNQFMSTKKDLIIGAFTNYDWSKVKYWANSIDKCGFTGDKAVIVYNCDAGTVQRLIDKNFKVWAFQRDQNGNLVYPGQLVIVVQRFLHLWQYLENIPNIDDYRYVISTDVKDVVFQRNPSEWLEQNLKDYKICASSESLTYEHEPWGADNMQGSYPAFYDNMKRKPIWNCGVQAGDIKTMKDLTQKKEQVYQQTKLAQILKPFDKLEALLDWAIYELQKKDKK